MAVAGEMSFSRAAIRVNVVQSALSTSVSKLEHELGVQLFDRRRNRINLTHAGEVLREQAGEILRAANLAKESVLMSGGAIAGTVNIGVLASTGPLDYVKAVAEFAEENPDVRLRSHLYQTGSWAYLPALAAGTLDLAFVSGPVRVDPKLEMNLLFEDPLVFVCRSSHPLAQRETVDIAELVEERLVGFPQEFGLRNVVNSAFHDVGLESPSHYELMLSFPDIAELVRRGVASCIMPVSEALTMTDLVHIELATPVLWKVYLASLPLEQVTRATARLAKIIMTSPGTVQHRNEADVVDGRSA